MEDDIDGEAGLLLEGPLTPTYIGPTGNRVIAPARTSRTPGRSEPGQQGGSLGPLPHVRGDAHQALHSARESGQRVRRETQVSLKTYQVACRDAREYQRRERLTALNSRRCG